MRSLIKNFRSNSEDWMNKGRREGGGSGKRDIGYIHGWLKLQKEDQKKSIIRKFCVLQDFILLQYPSEKTHETSAISIDLRGCVVVLQNEIVPAKWKRNVYAMKLKHNRREIVKDADYIIIYTASLEEQELWKRAIENASQWDAKKEKDKEKDKEKEKELAEDQENENDLPTNTSTTATTTAETKTKAGDDSNDDDEDSNNSFVDDDDDDITIESKREDYWHAESHGLRIETVHWLNSILLRFFQNIRHSEELVDGVKNSLETRLTTKLAQRNLDTYIAEFKVLQLDLGDGCPSITGVKIIPQPMPGEIGMDIQLDYNGNAKIALSATIHVNLRGHTYTSIPVVADATLRSLSGKLHLHCAPWPAERFSLSFYREPKMNIQLDTTMGENKQVKNFPKLGDLLLKKLKNTLIEKMVMPNRRYIRIPKSGGRKKRQATTANTNKPAATPTEAKNIPFPGVPLHKAPSAPSSSSASSATSASSSVAAAAASSSSSSSSCASSAAPSAPSSPSKEDKSVPFPGVPLRNTPPIPSSPPSSSSPAVPSPSPASSSAETTAIPVLPIAPSAAPTATSGTSVSVASVQNPKPQEATTLPTTIATTQATAELPENIAKETLTTSSSADKCNVQANAGTSKQANEAEGKKEKIDITASDGSSGNVAIPKHKRLSFSVKKKLLMPATTTTETDLIPESKHKQAPLPLPGRGQTTSASTKAASAIVDRNNPTQRKAVLSTWLESEASYVERMKPLIQFFSEQSCMDLAELHDMISEVMIIVNYHQKLYSDLRSRLTDAEGHLKGKDKVKKAASRIMIAQQHAAVSGDGKEQVEKMKEKAEEEYLFVYVGDLSLELADFAEIEMDHIGKVKHYLATLKILRKKNFSFHQVLMQRVSEGLPALEDMLQIPLSHMRLYSTIFEGLIHYTSVESELIVLQYAANKLKERTATIQQHKISEKVSETRHRAKRWLHDKLHKNEEGSSDGALT
ncbi:ERMES complex subunit mmm1, variant 2 [Balamuthia mandrillaris]